MNEEQRYEHAYASADGLSVRSDRKASACTRKEGALFAESCDQWKKSRGV